MSQYNDNIETKIRNIDAKACWPLRHTVLRPNQTIEDCEYPGDLSPSAIHLGAFTGSRLIGIASVFLEPLKGGQDLGSYRLRGMAVAPSFQSKGIGGQLLAAIQVAVREAGGDYIWCNARTTATSFYLKHGFKKEGNEFEISGIGPHYLMIWKNEKKTSG